MANLGFVLILGNSIVEPQDSYSLPRIAHVLDQLLGSTIFTTLDLKAGYWQVENG